ncbi:hypothetical protein Nmel_015814 [Mimus melanotis]
MHRCHSHRGRARCHCHPGYQLAPDGKACQDVNECLTGLAMCAHQCLNTRGSFKCTCNPGYELGADGKQCYQQLCSEAEPTFGWQHTLLLGRSGSSFIRSLFIPEIVQSLLHDPGPKRLREIQRFLFIPHFPAQQWPLC